MSGIINLSTIIKAGSQNTFKDVASATQSLADSYGRILKKQRSSFLDWLPEFFGASSATTEQEWQLFSKSFRTIIQKTLQEEGTSGERQELLKTIDTIQSLTKKRFVGIDPRMQPIVLSWHQKNVSSGALDREDEPQRKITTIVPKEALFKSESLIRGLEGGFRGAETQEIDLSDYSQETFDAIVAFLSSDRDYAQKITLQNCKELYEFASMHQLAPLLQEVTTFILSQIPERADLAFNELSQDLQALLQLVLRVVTNHQTLSEQEKKFVDRYYTLQFGALDASTYASTFPRYLETAKTIERGTALFEFLKEKLLNSTIFQHPFHAFVSQAEIFYQLQDYRNAITYYERAPASTLSLDCRLKRAHAYYECKEWSKCVDQLESVIKTNPDLVPAKQHARLVEAYCRLGEWGKAAKHYEKALALSSHILTADQYGLLASAYWHLKNWDKYTAYAEKAIEQGLKFTPQRNWNLANAYRELKNWDKFTAYAEKAIEQGYKPDVEANKSIANAYWNLKNWDKFTAYVEKAIEQGYKPDVEENKSIANAYLNLKNWDKYTAYAEKVIEQGYKPDVETNQGIAFAYWNLKNWDKYTAYVEKAIEQGYKPNVETNQGMAFAYLNLKNWDKYTAYTEKAIEQGIALTALGNWRLASAYRELKNWDKSTVYAEKAIEQGIELTAEGNWNLARAYWELREWSKCTAYAEKTIKQDAGRLSPNCHALLACAYLSQKDYDNFMSHADEAMERGYQPGSIAAIQLDITKNQQGNKLPDQFVSCVAQLFPHLESLTVTNCLLPYFKSKAAFTGLKQITLTEATVSELFFTQLITLLKEDKLPALTHITIKRCCTHDAVALLHDNRTAGATTTVGQSSFCDVGIKTLKSRYPHIRVTIED